MPKSNFVAKSLTAAILLFVISQSGLIAQSQTDTTAQVQAMQIDEDFEVTAGFDHSAWERAPSVYITHQVLPNDQGTAPVKTEVKVLYSQQHLYIGYICHDPRPKEIRANISDRDKSFQDDYVGLFLDPFNNNQHVYEFFVTPLGIQMDGMRTRGNEDIDFDLLWYAAGQMTDSGYRAVMKIPFKSLNFPERDLQDWSVQFLRNYPRSSRYQFSWSDINLKNSCVVCQSGKLTGIRDIENTKTVELLPYGMSYQTSKLANSNNPTSGLDHGPVQGRIGGSVSYSPTSRTSLNAVINPDFSQVETDAAQIGVNETFALFFSEKRPFFKKGSDLFNTPENIFYSRTINRPLAAGKFTQKADNYTLAFLTAYDRDAPFIVPGLYSSSQINSQVDAYNNILRGKYNFGSESYIGGLITTRNQQEGWNYVGSIDWDIKLADQYYFSGQMGYSDTKEIDNPDLFNGSRTFGRSSYDAAFNGERYGGTLVNASFSRQAKFYDFSFSYKSYSPTFQSQAGFINQTNRRFLEGSQSISYYPNAEWFTDGSFSLSGNWRYTFDGRFEERFIFARLSNSFAGQTNLTLSFLPLNDERFRGGYFTKMNRVMIDASTNPLNAFSVGAHVDFGRYVYRTTNPVMGKGYNVSANATIKPTNRLELNLSYSFSTLSSLDDSQNFFSGDIYRMTARYNFSKKLFARFISQYNSFNDQIQIYPLVYYKLNAFSKFYIGMTDYMNKFNQPGPNGFNGFKETNRQFFVKFQYLIRS